MLLSFFRKRNSLKHVIVRQKMFLEVLEDRLAPAVIWDWGLNANGQLGNANNTDSNIPVHVSNLTGITAIAGGYGQTMALKSDGTVWDWGYNGYGQLGNGTNTDSNIPVQVSNLTGVIAIAAGHHHNLALKSDGTVWDWGELGNGIFPSNVPVQVSNLTGVVAIAGGGIHNVALKSDGTVWDWGSNGSGQLGNGSNTTSYVPVKVSNLSGVTAIAGGYLHTMALKSDGTVWEWGANNNGQLGNGTNTDSNVPVQVSNLSGVTAIAAGDYVSVALMSNGSVRDWGFNSNGQLGNGANPLGSNFSNVPVQVLSLSGVTAIAGGGTHTLALKSDGTVWDWGLNFNGQLGIGTNTGNSFNSGWNVPVQVSNLSGVTAIAGGESHTIALVKTALVTPTVTVNPVNISYGTALANGQLTGTNSTPGSFTYTTDAGKILNAGTGQSVSVTFTPTDTADFSSVSTTVVINVAKATPTGNLNAVNITFGTALANGQLTGTSNTPGSFTYTTDASKILNVGNGQLESVTFTPTDAKNYTPVVLEVIVNVAAIAPSITTQPTSQLAKAGHFVTFTAAASGSPMPTVHWQISTAGKPYTDISGANSPVLTFKAIGALNGSMFRAVFSNAAGTTFTHGVKLTVLHFAPVVLIQPISQKVKAGHIATFTVVETASPTAKVQWQVSMRGSTTFKNITGANSTKLTVLATKAINGQKYRVVLTNAIHKTISTAATLKVL